MPYTFVSLECFKCTTTPGLSSFQVSLLSSSSHQLVGTLQTAFAKNYEIPSDLLMQSDKIISIMQLQR
jgi:hypothetical protein